MIGKVKYIGKNIHYYLIDGNIYDIVRITNVDGRIMLGIIDGDDAEYSYDLVNPHNIMSSELSGKWELVESYSTELTDIFNKLKQI